MNIMINKICPCGEIPDDIIIVEGSCSKWAFATGSCCGEWHIEFRTSYEELESVKCKEYATRAWNEAPRVKLFNN